MSNFSTLIFEIIKKNSNNLLKSCGRKIESPMKAKMLWPVLLLAVVAGCGEKPAATPPTPVPAAAAPSAMPPSAPLAVRPPRAAPAASTDTTDQGTAGAAAAATVAERVKKIVTEQLGVDADKVVPQARFVMDFGIDDGDGRDLVMAFEAEFGIEIPESVARTIITVGDATRAIEKILADEKKR